MQVAGDGSPGFEIEVDDIGIGFAAGMAFEIPKYKVRVAATYNSEIDLSFNSSETFRVFNPAAGVVGPPASVGRFTTTTPQSVNVDLQAPITSSTLVKAGIRWVNWNGVDFNPPAFAATFGQPVVEYTDDTITYRLTVAQRLTDNLAAFVTGSFEDQGDEEISLFKTTDGGYSLGGGFVVESGTGWKLTLGGEYRKVKGLSGVQSPVLPVPSDFDDADIYAVSATVGYRF